jgi:hypothetical protein
VAVSHGRPGLLLLADFEEARRLQNEVGTVPGPGGACPRAAWEARVPIGEDERARFLDLYGRALDEEEARLDADQDLAPNSATRATIGRAAARRTLCELDYLRIRRR